MTAGVEHWQWDSDEVRPHFGARREHPAPAGGDQHAGDGVLELTLLEPLSARLLHLRPS